MKNPIKQVTNFIKNGLTPTTELVVDGISQKESQTEEVLTLAKATEELLPEVLYEIDSVVDGKLVKLLGTITDEPVEWAKLVKIPDENGAMVQKYFKQK